MVGSREARRQAEIERGREISTRLAEEQNQHVARNFLAKSFDPDYRGPSNPDMLPDSKIDPEVRRQRDEYRSRMGAQVDKS